MIGAAVALAAMLIWAPGSDRPDEAPAPVANAPDANPVPAPVPAARPPPPAAPETVERLKQALQKIKNASMPASDAAFNGRERLLITHRPGAPETPGGPIALLAEMKEVEIARLESLDMSIVEVPVGWDLEHLRKIIGEDPSVTGTSRDEVVQAQGRVVPNDPDFGALRNLDHPGDVDVDAPEAWAYTTGSDQVVVAVLDTGIDYSHVELLPNLWVNSSETAGNGIDDDGNGYIDDIYGVNLTLGLAYPGAGDPWDDNGHGTWVASVIGARGNNNTLLTGVNWNVRIMSVKALRADGRGSLSDIARGIDYITNMSRVGNVNIKVVNASYGNIDTLTVCSTAASGDPVYNAITRLGLENILFVTSAGNRGINIDAGETVAPACYDHDHLITVTAQHLDSRTLIYNYGTTSIDVVAPGTAIRAAGLRDTRRQFPQSRKVLIDSGTTVAFYDAETDTGSWTPEAPWARTTEHSYSGLFSWTDSPGGAYTGHQNISLISPQIDLSGYEPGVDHLFLSAWIMTDLEYKPQSCNFCDILLLDMLDPDVSAVKTREIWSGNSGGWRRAAVAIPAWGYTDDFAFRFRLNTDPLDNRDGVYIDNVRISNHSSGADDSGVPFGTSFASPHVAGAAALLWAHRPDLAVSEVRAALLDTVDVFPDFKDRVASGGALNIANALFSVTAPGIRIHSSQTTVIEGDSGHLDVSLTREPRGTPSNVVLRAATIAPGRIAGTNPATLTFTRENWHRPQRIDFRTLANIVQPNEVEILRLSVDAAQSDPAYAAVSQSVAVRVHVEPGIRIHASQTTVIEGGSGYLDVSLTREPRGTPSNVVLRAATIAPGRIAGTNPSTLTFTRENWHRPQRIDFRTLANIIQPNEVEILRLSVDAAQSDPAYAAVSQSVAVRVHVEPGIRIHSSQTTVIEGGNGYLDVSLTRAPRGTPPNVILQATTTSASGRIALFNTPRIFRANNWHQPQTITFTVENDDAVQPTTTTEILQLSVLAVSSDPAYAAVSQAVAVRLINDDLWDVVNDESLTVNEGSSATVALAFNPLPKDVSMTVAIGYAPSPYANADDHQTPAEIYAPAGSTGTRFSVRITDDRANETTERIVLRITPSNPEVLGTQAMTVIVIIPANDPATATLEVFPTLLAEGSSAVVSVRLDIPPARDVAFSINAEPEAATPARYLLLPGPTIVISEETTQNSITLSARNNGVTEAGQTVTLRLSQNPGGLVTVIPGEPSVARVRIYDHLLFTRLRVFLEGAVTTDSRSAGPPVSP